MIGISLSTDLAASVRSLKKAEVLETGESQLLRIQTKNATKIYEGTVLLSEAAPMGDDNWY